MRKQLRLALELPLVVASVAVVALLVRTFLARAAFPFDLEWMEGGMLVHVWRIREGLGLYVEPGPDFIPYLYPPFYPWFLSLLGEPSYLVARSVSFAGTLAAGAAAVCSIRNEKGGWGLALGGAALYFACYDESGSFYDLVRADALAMGFTTWAIALCRLGSRRAVVAGGLCLVFGFLTKHNMALFGVPIVTWLFFEEGKRRALDFLLAAALPAGAVTLWIQFTSNGYFLTYLLGVPNSHPFIGEHAWPIAPKELATCVLYVSAVAWPTAVAWAFQRRVDRAGTYWLGIALTASLACVLMRAHHGGFVNVLMPGHWALSVSGVAMIAALLRRWKHPGLVLAATALMTYQLYDSRWDAERYSPTAADRAAGQRVIEAIASYEGQVFAPHFPWYPAIAGKSPSLPFMALRDIDHGGGPLQKHARSIYTALAEQRWEALLTPRVRIGPEIERHYRKDRTLSLPDGAFDLKTGPQVKPLQFWVPIRPAKPGPEQLGSGG